MYVPKTEKSQSSTPAVAVEKKQYTGLTKGFPMWINPTEEELKTKIGYTNPKAPTDYLGQSKDGGNQLRWDI